MTISRCITFFVTKITFQNSKKENTRLETRLWLWLVGSFPRDYHVLSGSFVFMPPPTGRPVQKFKAMATIL